MQTMQWVDSKLSWLFVAIESFIICDNTSINDKKASEKRVSSLTTRQLWLLITHSRTFVPASPTYRATARLRREIEIYFDGCVVVNRVWRLRECGLCRKHNIFRNLIGIFDGLSFLQMATRHHIRNVIVAGRDSREVCGFTWVNIWISY